MPAIKVENLEKKFNSFTAVDKVSFNVEEGELFGLLGPNGAGKTTIVNMLSTLLEPTSGRAEVAGFDINDQKNEVRKSIGIVFQEPALDERLTGRENLEFHAMMYGMDKEEINKRIREVLSLVELDEKADELVEKYSGGMKRRLEIARGLMQSPKILFLDEPTTGLDAQTRRHIWQYIRKFNRKSRVTIILTTHYMEEADYLCRRVAIVDKGRIVAMDTPSKLKDILGGDVITMDISGNEKKLVKKLASMKCIRHMKCIQKMKKNKNSMILTVSQGEKRIPEIVGIAQKCGIDVESVNLHKPSLEDVFIHFTGKSMREQEIARREISRSHMRRH